jgi:septum formation topological specificity factor MinE
MSQRKKIIKTKASELGKDVVEVFSKYQPLLLVLKKYSDDDSSTIRVEIQQEEELVNALVEFAKTGNGLATIMRFLDNSEAILREVRERIEEISKLN